MTTTTAPNQQQITDLVFNHQHGTFGESNVTYTRTSDGRKVEMTILYPSKYNADPTLIVASGSDEEMECEQYHQFLKLSKPEIIALRQLLLSDEVSDLLGVEKVMPAQIAENAAQGWQESLDIWQEAHTKRSEVLQRIQSLLSGRIAR
jgi:hypothetical protein